MRLLRALLLGVYTLVLYLGVPLLGWGPGDVRGFLALPQRLGYALMVAATGMWIAYQSATSPESMQIGAGQQAKQVGRQHVVRLAIVALLYVALAFLPFADRRGIAVMQGAGLARWIGLALCTLGMAFILWSSVALGRLYSPEVTVQKDHHLVTDGSVPRGAPPALPGRAGHGPGAGADLPLVVRAGADAGRRRGAGLSHPR